jgi:hypothetical protein
MPREPDRAPITVTMTSAQARAWLISHRHYDGGESEDEKRRKVRDLLRPPVGFDVQVVFTHGSAAESRRTDEPE